jgi:hypothetical protein
MPIMYEEYMITPFILTPMSQDQLKRILKDKVKQKLDQENIGKSEEERSFAQNVLAKTFDNMFMFL